MQASEYKTTHPKTRRQWRQWLQKNHDKKQGVWLIYYKRSTGKAKLSYEEAVEEALCFGWIDSTIRSLDAERFMQRFTPRKPGSGWSGINKERINKMNEQGLMMPPGSAKIEAAKKDGSWENLDPIYALPAELIIPDDLKKQLGKNKKAGSNFENFPVFAKRQFLYWIHSAKRTETRKARIKQTVMMAAANKKPGIKGFVL